MNHGVLQQVGSPEQLYTRPANVFVAGFIGSPAMNLVPAPLVDAGGQDRVAGFRPEHVALGDGRPDLVHFDGTVEVVEYLGDEQIVHLTLHGTPIVAKLPVEHRVANGSTETFAVPREKVQLFDAETGEALAG
jgi:ABC-type sugar transport system ATPase subunit